MEYCRLKICLKVVCSFSIRNESRLRIY